MKIKKEILVKNKKVVLSYNSEMFGKDANTLKHSNYEEAKLIFPDGKRALLCINGEEYYSDTQSKYIDDFYFEVVDMDKFDNELSVSYSIHSIIDNEKELIEVLSNASYLMDENNDLKDCPKGFVIGYCDEEASQNCEYSALNKDGLCGAECQDCNSEMFAYKEDKAYVCDCSKILFEDRHKGIRSLED